MAINEKKVIKEILKIHNKELKFKHTKNKKIIICFSGIPCTGKTYIAKIFENKYRGIRLNTDDIRKIIKDLGKKYPALLDEKYKEEILDKYLLHLIEKYPFKNKLIILDKGIDRDYEKVSSGARKHKFKLFLIRIIASKKTAEKGARLKLGRPDKNFINNINRWVKEHREFGKTHRPHVAIKNDVKKAPDLGRVFASLDKLIK